MASSSLSNPKIARRVREFFPSLKAAELVDDLAGRGQLMEVPAGTTIMDVGSYIKVMPLVTRGALKVLREDDNGDELFLYFLYPGQSCAMTLQCCLADVPSRVRAIAEDDTELIAVPVDVMNTWMKDFDDWKNFVIATFGDRFHELLRTLDSVVFHQLDERLLTYLKEKAKVTNASVLHTTHQDIAYDLHSSREVISRILKQLEKKGVIRLGRNRIELVL